MIIDDFANIRQYTRLLPHIPQALGKLDGIVEPKSGEKYEFEGGFLFFQEGETKPLTEALYEAHRKYADLQILLKGEEYLAWSKLEDLREVLPYDQNKDVQKFTGTENQIMKISGGMAYICFPWDGHKAVFHVDAPLHFTKVVIKLELNTI